MNTYIYISNNKYPNKDIIFECKAVDILEADKKFEDELGFSPSLTNKYNKYISVQIIGGDI